jgi:hypothetical protein
MNKKLNASLRILAICVFSIVCATFASAQATRTWVSGVGDDANPCSRTAPCKTLAGAISKTATNGEINAIDAGGFGAVTITKSITIDFSNILGGVLVSGTNAVIINGTETKVTLRGLDIDGLTTGLNGVKIISAETVSIENCAIYGFNRGISDERASDGQLSVSNTIIRNNNTENVFIGASNSEVKAIFSNTELKNGGGIGLTARYGSQVIIRNSFVTGNGDTGVIAQDSAEVEIIDSVISQNQFGVTTLSSGSKIRLSGDTVTMNKEGLSVVGGAIVSYGNNKISGNQSDGAPSQTIVVQ